MFEQPNFWASWPKKQKFPTILLMVLLFCSLIVLIISYYAGSSFVIDWDIKTISDPLRVLYDKFYSGLYEFSIYADNYLINKSIQPGNLHLNTFISYVFLIIFFLAVIFLYALATTLSRFYFILSSVFLAGILLTYRFENLILFGFYGKESFGVILLLFFAPGYYLHAFKENISISHRYIMFLCISALIALMIAFFSRVDDPFLYLASYQVIAPLIISVVFIVMLGFEIVKGFLLIVNRANEDNGKNNFIHFSILTIIYLLVLALIFLYKEGYISFKIIFIDAVWILIAAILFGLWGFKNKEEVYAYLFSFRPKGAYVYLVLAFICVTSFAFFFATANDPYVEILEQSVLITQLSFGLLFFVYITANFFPVMMEGHPVDKILYKPTFMPYFSAKLASIIGVIALFFLIKMAPYYQAYAGYYISLAQLFRYQKNTLLAEEYFKLSNIYGRQTHMGNYALAQIEGDKGNIAEKEMYLANAINVNPTEFAYAQFANMYNRRDKYFDEVFVLKNGVNEFPESGPLNNNLGLALSKTNIIDTALFYLEKAEKKKFTKNAALANVFSIYATKQIPISQDSLAGLFEGEHDRSILNNLMVIANSHGWKLPKNGTLKFEPGVNVNDLIYDFNYLFQYPDMADSASWKAVRQFYDTTNTTIFREELDYSFALAYAKTGHSISAFRILNALSYSDNYGYSKYDILMAQLYMLYGAPQSAIEYYDKTVKFYTTEMQVQYAVALMDAHKLTEAEDYLTSLNVSGNKIPQIVQDLLHIMTIETIDEVLNLNDFDKYNFLKYRGSELSRIQHEGIIISMEEEGYQYAAYVDYLQRLTEENDYEEFKKMAEKIPLGDIQSPHIRNQYLKLLASYYTLFGEYTEVNRFLAQIEKDKKQLGAYYDLVLAKKLEKDGDINRAEKLYNELASYDAFCETCILQSAEFFSDMKTDKLKAYNILLGAVQVNEYSFKLNKAYIRSSIKMGLDSYADDVLAKLSGNIDKEQLNELEKFTAELKQESRVEW